MSKTRVRNDLELDMLVELFNLGFTESEREEPISRELKSIGYADNDIAEVLAHGRVNLD